MVSIGRPATDIAATTLAAAWSRSEREPTLVSVPKTPVSEQEQTYRHRLGATIVQLRAVHAMSQATLAEKVERSEAAVSRWETGKATPTAFDLRRMADVFGLDAAYADLLVFPPETPTSPVAARLGPVTQPRLEPVRAADPAAAILQRLPEIVEEAERRRHSPSAPAHRSPAPSRRSSARAK